MEQQHRGEATCQKKTDRKGQFYWFPVATPFVEVLVRNPTASDVILLHGWCPPNRFDKRILLGQEELKDSKESVAWQYHHPVTSCI